MKHDMDQILTGLRRAGLRPTDRQWEAALEVGPSMIPALVELASDLSTLIGAEPGAFGPVHALRLLGEMNPLDEEVIERLLRTLPLPDPPATAHAPFVWRQDLPQILGGAGLNATRVAQRLLVDTSLAPDVRAAAAETMSYAVIIDEALRDEVTTTLRERLVTETDPYVLAYVIDTLGYLGVSDAYADVMAAFKRGGVDRNVTKAADVRPRLLSGRLDPRLECVRHTLTERYAQHGPYSEQQRQAMLEQYRAQSFGQ
jgi:hypothetical protein